MKDVRLDASKVVSTCTDGASVMEGPGTGKNVPVEVVVMAMRRVSFAALRVTRRALVFGRASSQNQKGSTHFHRAPALRKVIDLKPL